MPIGAFKDFDACVLHQKGQGHSDEEARRICGKMEADAKAAIMADLNGKWMEIFRAGDYGEKGKYSRQDLDKIAGNYDVNFHQSPIVVGHPKTDSPAYGWVGALRRSGDILEGRLDQVEAGFSGLLEQGRFKTRSVALYNDLGGKGLYLRHLGFLGAQPPEVKGLKSVFHDDQSTGIVEFVAAGLSRQEKESGGVKPPHQEEQMEIGDIKKVFVEALEAVGIGKKNEPPPIKTFSEAEVAKAATDAATAERSKLEKEFAEKQTAATAKADRKKDVREFTEKLKPLGKWIPAFDKAGLVAFMEALPAEATIEFGEGESKTKKSPHDVFKAFMEGLPKSITFGELAGDKKTADAPGKYEFNEGSGIVVDPHSVKLLERTKALMKENDKLKFEEAAQKAREELGEKAAVV